MNKLVLASHNAGKLVEMQEILADLPLQITSAAELGLGDVEALARTVAGRESYRSAGDIRVLHRYQRARAEPVLAMRLATDGLHKLFASRATPLVWLRNAGMHVVERAPLVKRRLIAGASAN
ncbi:MAG TPA: hypothetical protein DIW53_21265 [Achromobacter sp.]|nr:hypothetical protein [Achromobacter sp.]